MRESIIDLRSDTVTRPCSGMTEAMRRAKLGDDVYGEDPTVNALQAKVADITGHQEALYFPSGTQSNLVALLTHCQRADEYIVAQNAHTYKYEGGGAAALGGIQPQPIERNPDGTLDLDRVEVAIKADDFHFAKTRLLALENTTTEGMAVSAEYCAEARRLCLRHGLALHLDGARVFNAATALGIDVADMTAQFDSVSVCLSKGLGAPVGSVLCGSREFILEARRWRKVVGGGMRQAGVVAAAGIYALDNNVSRLGEDHANAEYLARRLAEIGDIDIDSGGARTNMVFFRLRSGRDDEFADFAQANGVLFGGRNPFRMVTHRDLSRPDIDQAIDRLRGFFAQSSLADSPPDGLAARSVG
ncbi:MAG: low-specificity L-threonine aldolase [Gammaproteobacteria bacterium]|nr:low-specificity L-threonine aldolase [Gammaproteobacteria bacterium]MYD76975.1 low-specificity L-threonine aldolase [Gammaproteobacteria bacterium]MYJ51129.1 low-specificity L-threonine aldolase [Gammaproteobacteria bacterium]